MPKAKSKAAGEGPGPTLFGAEKITSIVEWKTSSTAESRSAIVNSATVFSYRYMEVSWA
jgi:hypothetical protein